jgi:hypothetical protein
MELRPSATEIGVEEEVRSEKKSAVVLNTTTVSENFRYLRHSSYCGNLRVLTCIWRFSQKCRRVPTASGFQTVEEVLATERKLIRLVQEASFDRYEKTLCGILLWKEDGLLRAKTKILKR